MRLQKIALGLVAVLAITAAGISCFAYHIAGKALRPAWYEQRPPGQGLRPHEHDTASIRWMGISHDPETDLGLNYETVEFPARDDSTLRGWWVPAASESKSVVITVHGAGSDRREFLREVPIFHDAGFNVLLFDCRNHGVSDGDATGFSLGVHERYDVLSAVKYARGTQGQRSVSVIGTSQGAASGILAAAMSHDIDAVIAENPFTTIEDLADNQRSLAVLPRVFRRFLGAVIRWRAGGVGELQPLDVIDQISPRPLLLMHGSADTAIPDSQSRALFARAGEPKTLWIVEGAGHSILFNQDPEGYRATILRFLQGINTVTSETPK